MSRVPGVGSSNNYAYLVSDDETNDAVIIDPANPPEYVFGISPFSLSLSHRSRPHCVLMGLCSVRTFN
jgi:hypothetical protein